MNSDNKDQGPAGECGWGGRACEEAREGNEESVGTSEGGREQRGSREVPVGHV